MALLRRRRDRLRPLDEEAAYARCHGERDETVRVVSLPPRRAHYDLLDAHLAGREWLVGGERTVADLFLFMLTRWGRFLEPPAWDRPDLRAHWLRTLELPGARKVIEEQGLEVPEFVDTK